VATLLQRLGRFCARRRLFVIPGFILALVAVLAIAMAAGGSFEESSSIPGSPAQHALDTMDRHFPESDRASAIVVFRAPAGQRVDAPAYERAVAESLRAAAAAPDVATVSSLADAQTSPDGRALTADVTLDVSAEEEEVPPRILDVLEQTGEAATAAGLEVLHGGDAYEAEGPPIGPMEGIGLMVAFVVLLVTCGSLIAAGLPLLIALLGVLGSLGAMLALSAVVGIPSVALTVALMIGLAVGIDYALFIVSRHRTQLATGMDVEESIGRATATAGSAVVFAGITVIIALAGLVVAQVPMLTGMGFSAAGAVAVAVVLALTVVPALLGAAGTRLVPRPDSRAARRHGAAAAHRPSTMGARWTALATARPWLTVLAVVVLLGAMSIPALSLKTAVPDAGSAPQDTPARTAYDAVAQDFGPGTNGPLAIVVTADGSSRLSSAARADAAALADEIGTVPGVASVTDVEVSKDGRAARVGVVPTTGPTSPETKTLVETLRATTVGTVSGASAAVTGQTAVDVDIAEKLSGALAPFALVVVGLSLLLLLVAFRSVAIPIKAIVGFLLSLGAAFGATMAVFQWGWLAGLLGVPLEGPVASFMPIMTMAILFGLAMDYEVFVTSSVREQHERSGGGRASIVRGGGHAARVVTAAALIMVAVFASFLTHEDADIKAIAFALAVGVLVDAFVIRMTFGPAVLAAIGDGAWWMPRWLDRILPVIDVEGTGHPVPDAVTPPSADPAHPADPTDPVDPADPAGPVDPADRPRVAA
jgi:RND superfamily putative drug exporter